MRENSEQIALLAGETAERERLLDRFGYVVGNFLMIMQRTKKLTFLTAGYAQISIVFPFIVISPAYFGGAVQLGGLMQTASAFTSVQGALSFFVTAYRQLAEWRAVIARLDGFNIAVERARATTTATPAIALSAREDKDRLEIDDLLVRLPEETALLAASDLAISTGERVLLTGPSGAGKSTLFRAIAGTWPFGAGTIRVPKGAKLMILPQRPYFPIGTLAAAVSYPAEPGTFDAETLREVITAVGLPALAGRLGEEAHWNRMLSLGEQQRLGNCPRHSAGAGLSVPRRGDGLARRSVGKRALPSSQRAAQAQRDRIDRPSLDARRLSSPRSGAGARRRDQSPAASRARARRGIARQFATRGATGAGGKPPRWNAKERRYEP